MNSPQVKVDFNNCRFIATCACGQWRLEVDLVRNESTNKVLDKIDVAYLEHAKTCALTPGTTKPS